MSMIGIDRGGTKVEVVAINSQGKTIYSKRVSSPKGNYQHTLNTIVQLIEECEHEIGERGTIGIGTPGTISIQKKVLKNSNSTWLNGKPIHEDLRSLLGRDIRIANDANCFALSEASDGAAENYRIVFGVIIGTGAGGGIVYDRKLLNGPNGITGEWGHNPLPWKNPLETPGPGCYCGKVGCIETFLSGPGMANLHHTKTQQQLTPQVIVKQAHDGNSDAMTTLEDYYERLAKSLAHVINILDPDAIVLGGGMSNIGHIYREIPNRWVKYVFSDNCETRLLKAAHGDASGVRGAARLWEQGN